MHTLLLSGRTGERRRVLGAALVALIACGCLNGCGAFKSRTRAQEKHASKQKVVEKKADVVKQAADADIAKVEKEKQELKRKAKQIQFQLKRNEMREEAVAALDSGDNERAIEVVREIFRFTKEGVPAVGDDGQPVAGAEPVRPPPLQDGERARLLVIVGSALFHLDRRDDAINTFQKAVELDPDQRDARRNLGKLLFAEQRWAEAAEAFEKELADGFQDAEILFLLAKARYELSHENDDDALRESARLAMERVVLERPHDKEARYWRAMLTYETRRYRDAVRLLEDLRNDYPLDVEYLTRLADCYLQLGLDEKAIDYLEIATHMEPAPASRARTLSDLYASVGSVEQAADWRVRAYDGDPERAPDPERLQTGLLFADSGRAEEAVRWLSAVGGASRAYADAQARLAYLYQNLGEIDKAIAAYAIVAEKRPNDGMALLAMADIHMDREEHDEAIAVYSRAAALDETRADGLAGLAEVHYARGNLQQALREYQRALKARPDDRRFQAAELEIRTELEIAQHESIESPPGD